jgi:glycosyltransferase involved in cell wall biosynthesis
VTVHVQLIHPGNPFSPDPDGIVSVQRNFMRAAPADFRFAYWGVARPGVVPDRDGACRFHPVLRTAVQRPVAPLSMRFVASMLLRRPDLGRGVLRFDRIESALPFLGGRGPRVLFLHTWSTRDLRSGHSESRWTSLAPVHDRLLRRVVRAMDRVYVLRPEMEAELRGSVPEAVSRIGPFTIPVDLGRFAPSAPAERRRAREALARKLGISAAVPIVVFAGRLEAQKRPLLLPEVAEALAPPEAGPRSSRRQGASPPAHVVVAGTGSLGPAVRERAAALAPGRVHLIGSVAPEEMASLLGAADVLLLPSAFEGLPNVVLEALACGTPVVASAGAGRAADVVRPGQTGLIVEGGSPELAEALGRVLDWSPDVRRVCRSVAESFGPASVNASLYDDVRELAATSG